MKISDETKAKARVAALIAGVVASFLLMLFGGHFVDYVNDLIISHAQGPAATEDTQTY